MFGFGVARAPSEEWKEAARQFIKAAKEGNLATVRTLLEKWNEGILEAEDRLGMTALHWAAGGDHVDVVKYLFSE